MLVGRSSAAVKARKAHIDARGAYVKAACVAAARSPVVASPPPGDEQLGAALRELGEAIAAVVEGADGASDRLRDAHAAAEDALAMARSLAGKRDDIHS